MGIDDRLPKSEQVPRIRLREERPASLSEPIPREKLPKDLQKIVDKDDDFFESLYDGTAADTTDSSVRYAAYANRIRTIMLSAQRYVAYTSDIGESFRPVAHPNLVRGAYAVSWAYIIGDMGNEGYKAYCRNTRALEGREGLNSATVGTQAMASAVKIPAIDDYRAVMAQRAVFQSIASMGLPAFTIHSIVRYSGRALKNASNVTLRTWGPIGASRPPFQRVHWPGLTQSL
jgi:mitochondrial fission process protein 1